MIITTWFFLLCNLLSETAVSSIVQEKQNECQFIFGYIRSFKQRTKSILNWRLEEVHWEQWFPNQCTSGKALGHGPASGDSGPTRHPRPGRPGLGNSSAPFQSCEECKKGPQTSAGHTAHVQLVRVLYLLVS